MGESRGLKKVNAVKQKEELEKRFIEWVNADDSRKLKYGSLLPEMEKTYNEFLRYNIDITLINEAFYAMDFVKHVNSFFILSGLINKGIKKEELEKEIEKITTNSNSFFKNYNSTIDREIADKLIPVFLTGGISSLGSGDDYEWDYKFIDKIFSKSILMNKAKTDAFIASLKSSAQKTKPGESVYASNWLKKIRKDAAFSFVSKTLEYYKVTVSSQYNALDIKLDSLNRIYTQALREFQTDKLFYPDANSTLRLTYGKVEGYAPNDSITYIPFTTIDGIMEKENPNNKEFIVPAKLKELYLKKDYGQYAVNGTVPVCFIASNHTTGGNSGSPVLNAQGQLIGTNFDRNWEGTAADVMYDPTQARNISVDIRYTLFIIDKFAGAKYLLDEMTIIR